MNKKFINKKNTFKLTPYKETRVIDKSTFDNYKLNKKTTKI